jgi:hypothetical protein
MSFDENDYLSWYIPRIHSRSDAINLHSSGVPALDAADYPPLPGDPWTAAARFEEVLADWLKIPKDEVIFTPGATGGTLLALLALCRQNARIVVEAPIYEPMLRQATRLGPVARLNRSHAQKWRLPLDHAASTLGPDSGLVMITEPHNPSGRFSPREDVLSLARLARRFGVIVLINEVYRGFTDRPSYHGAAENIVVVSSLSKLAGAYWARLGWLSGPAPIIEKLRSAHRNMSMPASPAAATGLAVLSRIDELTHRAREISRIGQALVDPWVEQTRGIEWHPPEGPGFGCIRLDDELGSDKTFAEQLLQQRDLLLVPGSFFEARGTLRISWLQTGILLEQALKVLADDIQTRLPPPGSKSRRSSPGSRGRPL